MRKILTKKIVHKNPWFCIVHSKFKISDNKIGDYFIFKNPDSSIVIPIKNNKIVFIKQFRLPTNQWSLELPCGAGGKGLSVRQTAIKELREETGYVAKKFKKIGKFYPIPGRSGYSCLIFLATNLKFIGQETEETEEIKIIELSKGKVYQLVAKGKITDGLTLSALAIARKILLK